MQDYEKKFELINNRESNLLIKAMKPKLSPLAQRIIALTVLLTNKNQLAHKGIEIPTADLKKLLGLPHNYPNLNGLLNDVFKSELKEAIMISDDGKPISENDPHLEERSYTVFMGWFTQYSYRNGSFSFKIAPDLAKIYLNYKSNFTVFNLAIDNCLGKNKYANRLFRYIKKEAFKFESKQEEWEWRFRVDDLKTIFGIDENKYTVFADFKRKVLIPAIKSINTYTDYIISFNSEFLGKVIGNIVFTIRKKNKEEEEQMWNELRKDADIEEITLTLAKLEKLNNAQIINSDTIQIIEDKREE